MNMEMNMDGMKRMKRMKPAAWACRMMQLCLGPFLPTAWAFGTPWASKTRQSRAQPNQRPPTLTVAPAS